MLGSKEAGMRIRMIAKKGEEVIAEAVFEIESADDLRAFSHATLTEFRRQQPGVGLMDEDVQITWEEAD
jgi:hypothetical protein